MTALDKNGGILKGAIGGAGGGRPSGKALSPPNDIAKMMCFQHYGGVCSCCGEDNLEFLQMDHVDGDGAEHRKTTGAASTIFRWLVSNEYPDGFRVLCANCNWSRGVYGSCPHQMERDGKWTKTRHGWRRQGWEPIPFFLGWKKRGRIFRHMEEVEGEPVLLE